MDARAQKRKSQKGVLGAFKNLVRTKSRSSKDAGRYAGTDSDLSRVSTRHSQMSGVEFLMPWKNMGGTSAAQMPSAAAEETPPADGGRGRGGVASSSTSSLQQGTSSTEAPPDVAPAPAIQDAGPYFAETRMPGEHVDEQLTPGQFPTGADRTTGPDLLKASLQLPALLGLDYPGFDLRKFAGKNGFFFDKEETDSDAAAPPLAQSPPQPSAPHAQLNEKVDYFTYPAEKNTRKGWPMHVFRSTHKSAPVTTPSDLNSPRDPSWQDRDDGWSIIEGANPDKESEVEGSKDVQSSVPRSAGVSKSLHELDEVEINEFLNHFSRHTREVHLPHSTRQFTRMPHFSDFAYSSDEDEDNIAPFAPNAQLAERHRRSRLLMHVDRGLHMLESHDEPGEAPALEPLHNDHVNPAQTTSGNTSVRNEPYEVDLALESPDDGVVSDSTDAPAQSPKAPKRTRSAKRHASLRDDHVDWVAFCMAYLLALVEQYAPDDLDEAPATEYRESRVRSHIERLYIIAPFWEQLGTYLRRLYCWEDARRTAAAAMIYFVLWYADLLPTAFFMLLLYYVLQFRFFPQDESLLKQRVHERMLRGQYADRLAQRLKRRSRLDILDLYKQWARNYGVATQVALGDLADFHEKIKNLLLWRNPEASRRTAILLFGLVVFVTFASPALVLKMFFFALGMTFFTLMPLQTLYPRYRRALNPLWWAVLGAPTDGQWAIQLLRSRHARYQEWLRHNQGSAGAKQDGPPLPPALSVSLGEMRVAPAEQERDGDKCLPMAATSALAEKVQTKGGRKSKPIEKRRLDSFLCQHSKVPGHLNVTATHFYFSPLSVIGHGSKHCVTSIEEIKGLRKTHAARFWLWDTHGLQITRHGKNTLLLSNMARRDEAFNLLLTLASHIAKDVV